MLRVAFLVFGFCLFLPGSGSAQDERAAYVDVAGAPGDGEQALERAISNRLLDQGFTLTGTPMWEAYEVQGTVRLMPAGRGKEKLRIDWTIFGPEGTYLGSMTQVKEVKKGSLDKKWGAAAEGAAAAAIPDLMQILPAP